MDNKINIRVILKSGAAFVIKFDKFTLNSNSFNIPTGYSIDGITENKPIYIDFNEVAAIVRLVSNEKQGTEDTP